ncbi:MAG TPA: hypothetical protein VL523_01790, partial [Terriglobia bacterium]|nr:hypothetical protein [Terriglobia bacterium]
MQTGPKRLGVAVVMLAGFGSALPAQDQPPPHQQAPPTLSRPSDQRPTLGEGPSSGGPHSASTNDRRKLLEVRAIFIQPMDNGLAEKLIEAIGNDGHFRLVANQREADAVLRGTCFDSTHLKTVHSEVFLAGRDGSSIWQDVVRQPYRPPPLAQAVAATAQTIAED